MSKLVRHLSEQATASVPAGSDEFVSSYQRAYYQMIVGECMDVLLENSPTAPKVDPLYGEAVVAIGDHFFRVDEVLGNPIERVAKLATDFCCKEYKDHIGSTAWLWEEAFARTIIEECLDTILECDPSTKMVAHEPWTSMTDYVYDHFYGEDNE